jgi:hypothetical protein
MGKRIVSALCGALLLAALACPARAEMSSGQTLYVPCSSTTYHGPKSTRLDLTVTLIVRNVDPKRSLALTSVEYYRTDGRLVRRYLDKPVVLGPLSAKEFVVDQADTTGGTAASFLVRWRADAALNEPLAEAVMISSSSSLGISYVSRGLVIKE